MDVACVHTYMVANEPDSAPGCLPLRLEDGIKLGLCLRAGVFNFGG